MSTDEKREISYKVVSLLEIEKCTVGEAHDVLRLAEAFLNNSPVSAHKKD